MTSRGLVRRVGREQARLVGQLVQWIVLGSLVGVVAGLASAGFLESLDWATRQRIERPRLLWLMPLAGFAIGLVYHHGAGRASAGTGLVIEEIHEPRAWIPRRMAPLVYGGTIVTHLVGGSAGREGTAIQMAGSLTDLCSRLLRLGPASRRLMLIAAIAGGFGSVFGVPLAGCVFALEVQTVGRLRHDALVPALTASVVGHLVVLGLDVRHTATPAIADVDLDAALLAKVALAGLVFGLTSAVFVELTHGLRRLFAMLAPWAPLRPALGGVLLVGLTAIVGTRDYLGLSLPLATGALAGGAGMVAGAFALKLVFTSLTLGSGFQGGEVTPLFVIGATLGVALGRLLDAPVPLMAALGFVAVFAGAAKTPLACTIMGVELFGSEPVVPLAVGCVVAYVFSTHRGIYSTQRFDGVDGVDRVDRVAPTADRADRVRRTGAERREPSPRPSRLDG